MARKNYIFSLPYFKQGDDLAHFLNKDKPLVEAVEGHVQLLLGAVELLRELQLLVKEVPDVELDADTHIITVTGEVEALKPYLEKGLLESWGEDEEDEEQDPDEEYEEECDEEDPVPV